MQGVSQGSQSPSQNLNSRQNSTQAVLLASVSQSQVILPADSSKSLNSNLNSRQGTQNSNQNLNSKLNLSQNSSQSLNLQSPQSQNSAQAVLLADISQEQSLQNQSPQSPQNSQNSAQNTSQSPQTDGIRTYQLDEVNINSVGDSVSESGISEGILNKSVASGPLDNKKVFDMPYSINTVTNEVFENQGVQTFDEAVKYFPSVTVQYAQAGQRGFSRNRGFQGYPVGGVLWDGFYAISTTATSMMMFENLQVLNGLSGSLYGGQPPGGMFLYTRKRPLKDYNSVWVNYFSRKTLGVGWDTSDKFEYVGYRAVFYDAHGEREPKGSDAKNQLAYLALDFYLLENLIFETNFSHYSHIMTGFYGGSSVRSTNGVATGAVPDAKNFNTISGGEVYSRTLTASGKFKYTPISALYLEGGYQWQKSNRSRTDKTTRFTVPSAFLKAQGEFETGFIRHNVAASVNGFQWIIWGENGKDNLQLETKNVSLLYDIGLGEHFNAIFSGANSWFKQDNYKKSGLSWAGSVVYKIIPSHLNVYFTYADSLRPGTAHYYGENSDGTFDTSHSKYGQVEVTKPYRSYQYELGVKGRVSELDLSLALFQITRPSYYEYDNTFAKQGDQRNRGVEFMAGGKIIEPLSVYGGVTYLDAELHKSPREYVEGKTMIGEPKFRANVLLDFAVPYTNQLSFSTNLHFTDKRFVDEMNTKSTPSYFTMDLGARYSSKELVGKETIIRFNVSNLFDKAYWVGVNAGSVDGASNATSLFRGLGRTFMLSGQVKF